MLGLGSYESSSEDEQNDDAPQPKVQKLERSTNAPQSTERRVIDGEHGQSIESTNLEPSGPVLGPSHDQGPAEISNEPTSDPHPSDFTAVRALVQDLTLPPVPKLDIPPSPPGSPDPGANAKFAHFLSLKKQDVHFNQKLAGSTSLKNPSLLGKLREHAGISDQGQYATSLPNDIWDVSGLPNQGYKEALLKTQQDIRQKTEESKATGQRTSVEFVPGAPEPNRTESRRG